MARITDEQLDAILTSAEAARVASVVQLALDLRDARQARDEAYQDGYKQGWGDALEC